MRRSCYSACLLACAACSWNRESVADSKPVLIEIGAVPVSQAMKEFEHQTKVKYVLQPQPASLLDTLVNPVRNWYTPEDALAEMLRCTGLIYRFENERSVFVNEAEPDAPGQSCDNNGLPQVFVKTPRTANGDLEPESDGALAYSVVPRREIARSMARNANEVIQQLPMVPAGGTTGSTSGGSTFDFHRLGAANTSVLIDGRKMTSGLLYGVQSQPDISGIPLAAIERVEILEGATSAVIGGSAGGGAINITLQHECAGTRISADVGDSFLSGGATQSLFASHCISDPGDDLQILLTGAVFHQNPLYVGTRDYTERGRNTMIANDPAAFYGRSTPVLGDQMNVKIVTANPGGAGLPAGTITTLPRADIASRNVAAAIANAGHVSTGLAANSAQAEGGDRTVLLDELRTGYADLMIRKDLSSALKGYVEFVGYRTDTRTPMSAADSADFHSVSVPADAPGNFLQEDLIAAVPVSGANDALRRLQATRRFNGHLRYDPGTGWGGDLDFSWSHSRFQWSQPIAPAAAFALASNTVNVFDIDRYDFSTWTERLSSSQLISTSRQASAKAWKSIRLGRDSRLELTASLEGGGNHFDGGIEQTQGPLDTAPTLSATLSPQDQSTNSVAFDAQYSLQKEEDLFRYKKLELRAVGRLDWYRSETRQPRCTPVCDPNIEPARSSYHSANPTFAALYRPVRDIGFRASYSTGIRTPTAEESAPGLTRPFPGSVFAGPSGGPRAADVVNVTLGGNPRVSPENLRSWSAGIVLEPRFMPRLKMSFDYTLINAHGEIEIPADQVLSDYPRFSALYPDSIFYDASGAIIGIDGTARNIAEAQSKSWEAIAQYDWQSLQGYHVDLLARVSSQAGLRRRASLTSDWSDLTSLTGSAPTHLGGVLTTAFSWKALSLDMSARYLDRYRVSDTMDAILSQGGRNVPSQFYLDASIGYLFGSAESSAPSTEIRLGITNLLNREPRTDITQPQRGYISVQDDPRMRSLFLSATVRFATPGTSTGGSMLRPQ